MDDDDESIPSLQILTECDIGELASKCKPLNVNLSRLNLSKNGIILVKADTKRESSSSPERETVSSVKKRRQESNSNDTAETIKKIKEFIAQGRCDETKKDAEHTEKVVTYKPGPLSKKKILAAKDSQKVKSANTNIAKLNMGLELERTLKGQDDEDYFHTREVSDQVEKEASRPPPNKESATESKVSDVSGKNSELVTPSRVSKRIQSKSVKFSVKKLLRGDDVNVLKRMIPGYDKETPPKKERTILKTMKHEVKKIQQQKLPSPPSENVEEADETSQEPALISPAKETAEEPSLPAESRVSTPENIVESPSSPSPVTSSPNAISTEQKVSSLAEKLGKFSALTNGKITLELKGAQEKKVVRIAIPPPKAASPLPKTSLGPDIIVKRVKPVKKTIIIPENVKPTPKTVIEKIIEEHRPPPVNSPRISKVGPFVNVERIPAPKSRNEILQIQKSIIKRGRPEKKLDHLQETRASTVEKPVEAPSSNTNSLETPQGTESDVNLAEDNDESITDKVSSKKKEEPKPDTPSLTQQITEALESTVSRLEEETPLQEDKRKLPDKLKTKKSYLSQLKSKVETPTKKISKPRKPDVVPEKSPPASDVEEAEDKNFNCVFDKYFKTEERYIEHHDSLDSDSSEEFDKEIFSHFINLRRHKDIKRETEKREDITMYELMRDISVELPSWNIHVSSNGEIFYLAQVDTAEEIPTMKKVIEIDLQYNAKVYVDGNIVPEYEGNYSSYEDIKQLVYDIDQL